jgi:hypothetical protein
MLRSSLQNLLRSSSKGKWIFSLLRRFIFLLLSPDLTMRKTAGIFIRLFASFYCGVRVARLVSFLCFVLCFVFLRSVCLDCLFLIASLVFFHIYSLIGGFGYINLIYPCHFLLKCLYNARKTIIYLC